MACGATVRTARSARIATSCCPPPRANLQFESHGFSTRLLGTILSISDAKEINRAYGNNIPEVAYGIYGEIAYNLFENSEKLKSEEFNIFVRYEKLDMNAARKTAEIAIQLIGAENYDELSKLYTPDFRDSEAKGMKEKKFSEIIHVIGKTEEFSIIDSSRVTMEETDMIVLKYKVKHATATTTETYTIAKEEGNYLLANIYITNK